MNKKISFLLAAAIASLLSSRASHAALNTNFTPYVFFATNCETAKLNGFYYQQGRGAWQHYPRLNTGGLLTTNPPNLTSPSSSSYTALGHTGDAGDPTTVTWRFASPQGIVISHLQFFQITNAVSDNGTNSGSTTNTGGGYVPPTNSVPPGQLTNDIVLGSGGIPISQLPPTNTVSSNDLFVVDSLNAGTNTYTTHKVTAQNAAGFFGTGGGGGTNAITISNSTNAPGVVTGSNPNFQIGTNLTGITGGGTNAGVMIIDTNAIVLGILNTNTSGSNLWLVVDLSQSANNQQTSTTLKVDQNNDGTFETQIPFVLNVLGAGTTVGLNATAAAMIEPGGVYTITTPAGSGSTSINPASCQRAYFSLGGGSGGGGSSPTNAALLNAPNVYTAIQTNTQIAHFLQGMDLHSTSIHNVADAVLSLDAVNLETLLAALVGYAQSNTDVTFKSVTISGSPTNSSVVTLTGTNGIVGKIIMPNNGQTNFGIVLPPYPFSGLVYFVSDGTNMSMVPTNITAGTGFNEAARMYQAGSQSVPGSTVTQINFDTKDFDTDSIADTTNHRFNIQSTGKYRISCRVHSTSTGIGDIYFGKNGTYGAMAPAAVHGANDTAGTSSCMITADVACTAGDNLEVFYYGNSFSTYVADGNFASEMSIEKIAP